MLIRALQAAAGNFGVTGYAIDNSLRFNDNDSAYLSRTPATAGNRKTWTWSGWVKRGNLSASGSFSIFQQRADSNGSQQFGLQFRNDAIRIIDQNSSVTQGLYDTTAVFRDVSGWYHIVVACDTTDATAGDRVKLYVNGVRVTSFSAPDDWPLNYDTSVNSTVRALIGTQRPNASATLNSYFDGYLAEINFIDGQALTPEDFGEINATTGEWSPIAYSGTYGTNGFYLPFDGNANDDSGNGNNWTENNLASTDYMIDTPTNNFSVFNVLSMGSTFSNVQEGNLEFFRSSTTSSASAGTMAVSSGKYYYEIYLVSRGSEGATLGVGIQDASLPLSVVNGYAYYFLTGQFLTFSAGSAYGSILVAGDILGVAYDLDAGTLTFYKNGVSLGVAISSLPSVSYIPLFLDGGGNNASQYSSTQVLNFGADSSFAGNKTRQGNTDANGIGDFYYEPPAGFLALCEDNLELIPFVATGGTETTISDGGINYKVHTFTSSDTFEVTSGYKDVEYLVVAGGGGGGRLGGGGGAGGYRSSVVGESSGGGASAEPKLAVSAGSYTVTVGAGGVGGTTSGQGSNGGNSVFASITSLGGGAAGGAGDNAGENGGSGGGGTNIADGTSGLGGSGTAGQGFDGGDGNVGSDKDDQASGGGGGAGEAGTDGASGLGGDGGDGVTSLITGASVTRAGGGGGTFRNSGTNGSGGLGGGGDGSETSTGESGIINTGGGGGGGARSGDFGDQDGGNGGSGIVIIRYAV